VQRGRRKGAWKHDCHGGRHRVLLVSGNVEKRVHHLQKVDTLKGNIGQQKTLRTKQKTLKQTPHTTASHLWQGRLPQRRVKTEAGDWAFGRENVFLDPTERSRRLNTSTNQSFFFQKSKQIPINSTYLAARRRLCR
jgi:hypothetical protein